MNSEVNHQGLPQQKIFMINAVFEGIASLHNIDLHQEPAPGDLP